MDLSELYRDVVESSPDGLWVIDLRGRTIYANPEIARLHRIGDEGLAALSVSDTLDEGGRARFRAHLEGVREGRLYPRPFEVQWVRSDGTTQWVLCSETALLDGAGQPWALLRRYTDNTDRHELIESLRASEEALEDQVAQNNLLRAIASAANQATTLGEVLGHARCLVLQHDSWERARAFVPAADTSGRVEPYYQSADDREEDVGTPRAAAELALAQRAHDTRGPVWDEARLTLAFPILLGSEVYAVVAITSAPPLDRHELIETTAGRVAEQLARVAERERAQAEVARARDEAMEASRQKSDFLATMSHEIRTPLNGVIGLNDLLLRTSLDPEQHRLSAGVQAAGRTLLGLINDILDFSKIEAGRLELERVDFDVRLLLEEVSAMLTELAREKRLDLVVSCHPEVPAVLSGDPTRLAQVITNLVSNAVKFTEQGMIAVRATVEPDDGRLRLRVTVADTGVGVPHSQLPHLFEPFTQGDSSTTRIYGGTGLGLAISSELVGAMGGTLEYTANPAGGSVLACTVVLDHGVDPAAANPEDVTARELLHGRRALVVAGEPHASVLSEQLAWWGVESDRVATASGACALLDRGAYDVVMVDGPDPGTLGGVAPVVEHAAPHPAGDLRLALLRVLAAEPGADVTAHSVAEGPGKGRILVVEDNPVNQMVATGLLAALGYTSGTADDGLAAIETAGDGSFDAILMDVQMPHMDGYTATRHIRALETGRRQPIIAMTAAAIAGERERCLEAGMDDFLTKPVDASRLAETLKRWLAPTPWYADRLDLDRLEELRGLDDPGDGLSYVDRAIANFLGSAGAQLASMQVAAASGDADQLRAVAHRLAGSALNLGASALGEGARELEVHIMNGSLADAVAALPALAELMEVDLEALRAYQQEHFAARAS
jgi:PAS domain S-box-containing protein